MSEETEEQVRRLLADARHTEPMPDDVAARLDRTLARASDERVWTDRLAARSRRTRRQRITGGLVAAAVVVAAGIGISRIGPSVRGGSSDSSSVGSSDSAPAAAAEGANQAQLLPVIRPGHVRADLRERAAVAPRRTDTHVCVAGSRGQVARSATYAGRLAALVYDPVRDGQRRVTLYRCDGVHGGAAVASVLIPAR